MIQGAGPAAVVARGADVAELELSYAAYESALSEGDVEAINAWFAADAELIRFGVADEQWSAQEVRHWRAGAAPVPPGRYLVRTRISVIGADTAVVASVFGYPSRSVRGRQTQVWVRTAEGWRIAHAHVSELPCEAPPAR